MRKTTPVAMLAIAGLLCTVALGAGDMPRDAVTAARACDPAVVDKPPSKTTVMRLMAMRAAPRSRPRAYALDARILSMSRARRSIDVLLGAPDGSAATVTARFAEPGCGKRSRLAKAMRRARAALIAKCGTAPRGRAVALSGEARVTGVRTSRAGTLRVLRFRARSCGPAPAPAAPGPVSGAGAAPAPVGPPPLAPPAPEPPPEPEPEPSPDCTTTLTAGAIGAEANRAPGQVICLETGYYREPPDAVIVIVQDDVRLQAAPGAYPIVCGRFAIRGERDVIAPDVHVDPACAAYFNEQSPWNKPASSFGPPVPVPPDWLNAFDHANGTKPLEIATGWDHGKAIFRAAASDTATATFRIADATQCFNDPAGCGVWQPTDPTHRVADETASLPDRIPIPAGVRCPGLPLIDDEHDRAVTIISADGRTAWDLWHCTHAATPAEPWYTAAVAAKWSLDPDDPASVGYQDQGLTATGSTSARGSGTPLLPTTVTPREALEGIRHPLGLTVLDVSNAYVNPPASHTDGCAGCSSLEYGMLFVLDPAFKPPVRPSRAEQNIILALKRYGAYVVDQGPSFEIDGSPNEPTDPGASDALWRQARVALPRLGIEPSDFRYVPTPGAPPVP